MIKRKITTGAYWIEIPEADLRVLCGTPADVFKHLKKQGLIITDDRDGFTHESGPNAILLSDVLIQEGRFSNLSEFPVLQMLYRQGMLVPEHPNNTGVKPLLIGSEEQVKAQLRYIYRGNYGLISREELRETGIGAELAEEMMGFKLRFAFGAIHPSRDFLDSLVLDGARAAEIRNGVTLRRTAFNRFQFQHGGRSVTVDLNLPRHETYQPAYVLPPHPLERHYFSIIHSGEGDGWDVNRPCMASIICHRGRIYLIDAGPNLRHSLNALGIDPGEIAGIFHTHSHDDHFAGLPTLMRADRPIKYYTTPLVRASVTKKFSALLDMPESRFQDFFEIHDLEPGVWNDVDGLEVKPVYSPHPVETNMFLFRSLWECGYRSYGHFADTTSLEVLRGMIVDDRANRPGISAGYYETIKREYASAVDIKKIDVGGGLIHGNAGDFRGDRSPRLLLSHTSQPLSHRQRQIGSETHFGKVDVLIPAHVDYDRERAGRLLHEHFPKAREEELAPLLNGVLESVDPTTIVLRRGTRPREILLPVSGWMERLNSETGTVQRVANGTLIGRDALLAGGASTHTYRSVGHLLLMHIPIELFLPLQLRHRAPEEEERLVAMLRDNWLCGDGVSEPQLRRWARKLLPVKLRRGELLEECERRVVLVASGTLEVRGTGSRLHRLTGGECCVPALMRPLVGKVQLRAERATLCYTLPLATVKRCPVVQWKFEEMAAKWRAIHHVESSR